MIKAVIFDFDDTLCLTEELCFHLENKVAENMGFPPMSREAHQENWGKFTGEAIVERIPGIDADEFMKRQGKLLSDYISKGIFDSIPKENLEVLDRLVKAEKQLAIVTSRSFLEVRHLLHEKHALSSRVEAFFHRENLKYLKPDPRVFDQVLDHFKIKPDQSVYVGDSISDAVAAKGAGMHFIAVLESGLRSKKDFSAQKVDFFAKKFIDINTYILSH